MYNLLEVIAKPVLSVYEGIQIGFVKNVCFSENLKKVSGFVLFDDENENGEMYLNIKNVYAVGQDCVLVRNVNAITNILPEENSPINFTVVSLNGKYEGKIKNVQFDKKFIVSNFITNTNFQFKSESIKNIGENVIFYSTEKFVLSRLKPKLRIDKNFAEKIKVNILTLKENTEEEQFIKLQNIIPQRVQSKDSLLIGKTAKKTVFGFNNEFIVKKGQVITEKTIHLAKQHSKINELIQCINN